MRLARITALFLVLLTLCVIPCTWRTAEAANLQSYSFAGDFSITLNPHNQWGYGWSTSPGTFNPYDAHQSPFYADEWYRSSDDPNATSMDIAHYFSERAYTLSPGPNGEYSIARWTAPVAGKFVVAATFTGFRSQSNADVRLLKNQATLFQSNLVGTQSISFNGTGATVTVAANDTIDFAVGFGSDHTNNGDRVILSATIQPVHEFALSNPQAVLRNGPPTSSEPPGRTFILSVDAIDTDSSVSGIMATVTGPSGAQSQVNLHLASGTAMQGTWLGEYIAPPTANPQIEIYATVFHGTDSSGNNSPDVQATFQVDGAPPVLNNPQVSPDHLSAQGGNTTVTVAAADDRPGDTGVTGVDAVIKRPSGTTDTLPLVLTSGDNRNGTWTGQYNVPAATSSDQETYIITFRARDLAGNQSSPTSPINLNVEVDGAKLSLNPTALDFGICPIGEFRDRRFAIKNVGRQGSLLHGEVAPISPPYRVLTGGGSFSLRRGQTQWVIVRYEPIDRLMSRDTVYVTSSDPSNSSDSVQLTGTPSLEVTVWVKAFIPQSLPSLTRVIGSGPYVRKTGILGPNPFTLFLSDQRSFNTNINASARMTSEARIDAVNLQFVQTHYCDPTIELALPRLNVVFRGTGVNNGSFDDLHVDKDTGHVLIHLSGSAHNPAIPGSPDIDYLGWLDIDVVGRTIQFRGLVDSFPAFEMYVQVNRSPTLTLFQILPAPGTSPWNLPGGPTVPAEGPVGGVHF